MEKNNQSKKKEVQGLDESKLDNVVGGLVEQTVDQTTLEGIYPYGNTDSKKI
ncbi:MAG: hypothetical protein LBF33_02860 [Oscillospiraceae bacterium]|jgi:hypothetical protein|nr:hypothetical protein [Oscillospiraceae bacterium]